MKPKTTEKWYKAKGKMQLFKNDLIREYTYPNVHDRRRMYKIWMIEIKPNGIDELVLVIKPNLDR